MRLFTRHRMLTQVAGQDMAVLVHALRAAIKGAQRMPSLTKVAFTAASAGLSRS